MKNTLLTIWMILSLSHYAMAQKDTIIIEGKNEKRVVVIAPGEESEIILKDSNSRIEIEVESEAVGSKEISWTLPSGKVKVEEKDNYSINFLSDFSFGYATVDQSFPLIGVLDPYRIPILNNGFNFSMNILKQEINLIKHQLYLTTAFGLNNYYFSLNNERLVPRLDLQSSTYPRYAYGFDSVNNYRTNRVDSRFLSVPIMLKWNPKNKKKNGKVGIAAGVELNFRNRLFAKLRIDENQREQTSKFDLGINNQGIIPSYILRLQYGNLGVFTRITSESVIPNSSFNWFIERNLTFGIASKF